MLATIKKAKDDFLNSVAGSNELFFYALFLIYVSYHLLGIVGWNRPMSEYIWSVYFFLFTCVMWGSAVLLFFVMADCMKAWKKTWLLLVLGLCVFFVTILISRTLNRITFTGLMGLFLSVMACGKDHRKILRCLLIMFAAILLFALAGLWLGCTRDITKPERAFGGHSLGIIYPNNWGYLVFGAMMNLWYLFMKKKKALSFLLFWAAGLFMYRYITCLTIAALAFAFPPAAAVAEILENRAGSGEIRETGASCPLRKFSEWFTVLLPFVFFGGMMFLCLEMDRIHDLFYDTPFRSMAMRFVEGGFALRNNQLSLFGLPFNQIHGELADYQRDIELINDSAYVTYLINRGVVPMFLTLLWIALAHWKCVRKKDYRLLAISIFMLVFSMMERPGLDAWYNFVMLYPLAAPDPVPGCEDISRPAAEEPEDG